MKTGFSDLSEDLAGVIVSFLEDDRPSMLALLLVSRNFYRLAKPFLYHEIFLHVLDPDLPIPARTILGDSIRGVTIPMAESMTPNIRLYTKKFSFAFLSEVNQSVACLRTLLPSLLHANSLALLLEATPSICSDIYSLLPTSTHLTELVLVESYLDEAFYQFVLSQPSLELLDVQFVDHSGPEYLPSAFNSSSLPRLYALGGPHKLIRQILPAWANLRHLTFHEPLTDHTTPSPMQLFPSLQSLSIVADRLPTFVADCANLQYFACFFPTGSYDISTLSYLSSTQVKHVHLVFETEPFPASFDPSDLAGHLFDAIPTLIALELFKRPHWIVFSRRSKDSPVTSIEPRPAEPQDLWQGWWKDGEEEVQRALGGVV